MDQKQNILQCDIHLAILQCATLQTIDCNIDSLCCGVNYVDYWWNSVVFPYYSNDVCCRHDRRHWEVVAAYTVRDNQHR